ncbi:MAG: nickel-responsive transcriptional regulator NikR [Candidatus Altiarchaeota archaeon]
MDRATRFGISIPQSLSRQFDETIKELRYANRSKAIQDALNDFIKERRWHAGEGEFTATLSFIYDHHTGDVTEKLTHIQHDHDKIIRSTMHSHITHELCCEVLIAKGKRKELSNLADKIAATRGVVNCKLAILS